MTTLVQHSCSSSVSVIQQMLLPILQKLEETLNPGVVGAEAAQHLQDCLCGLLQVILIKVGHLVDA